MRLGAQVPFLRMGCGAFNSWLHQVSSILGNDPTAWAGGCEDRLAAYYTSEGAKSGVLYK